MITDGEPEEDAEKTNDIRDIAASDIMTKNPKTIDPDTLVVTALNIMQNNNITQLLVLEKKKYWV